MERRRWYAQLQFSRYLLEELQQLFVKNQQMVFDFEFYRVLLRSVNDSVLISWNDVVECTVSFQQMKISADSLLK
ncbi:hypothetical protein F511_20985 [Dorcoceras hygrometricum]|uniref:Uncharacterized protein n=1 Tax=Dorcoceras hygrometricum TaxID=472368 RepID=A0A2Z7C1U3_9LAMI|nr:hypothetical protein F511_20985 [Dorcoceras hygrometricum]